MDGEGTLEKEDREEFGLTEQIMISTGALV
jgi:hypothetical protein